MLKSAIITPAIFFQAQTYLNKNFHIGYDNSPKEISKQIQHKAIGN
jgi:hypothetical protein